MSLITAFVEDVPSMRLLMLVMTPLFWYSATFFSKKFVFPCRLMRSIPGQKDSVSWRRKRAVIENDETENGPNLQSKGFLEEYKGLYPKSISILSATNSTY